MYFEYKEPHMCAVNYTQKDSWSRQKWWKGLQNEATKLTLLRLQRVRKESLSDASFIKSARKMIVLGDKMLWPHSCPLSTKRSTVDDQQLSNLHAESNTLYQQCRLVWSTCPHIYHTIRKSSYSQLEVNRSVYIHLCCNWCIRPQLM